MEKKGLNFLLRVLLPVSHLILILLGVIIYAMYTEIHLLNFLLMSLTVAACGNEIFIQIKYNYAGLEEINTLSKLKTMNRIAKMVSPHSRGVSDSLSGENLVTFFAKQGSSGAMKYLMMEGFNLNEINIFEQAPIQIAIRMRDKEMIEELLSLDVSINTAGSVINEIIKENDCDYLKYLIDLGISLDEYDDIGNFPAHNSIMSASVCSISQLKKANVSFAIMNSSGHPPLINAIINDSFGDMELSEIKEILSHLDLSILNELDYRGESALMHSISLSQPKVAEILIDRGVNLDIVSKVGVNIVNICLEANNNELTSRIIKKAPYLVKGNGRSVVDIIKYADKDLLRDVLSMDIDIDYRGEDGKTFLDYAINRGDINVIDLLISNGVNLNRRDESGRTSIFSLVMEGQDRYHLFESLLRNRDIDMGIQDNGSRNLLSYSILNGLYEEAELLIGFGLEIQLRDDEALNAIKGSENKDLLKLLIKNNLFPSKFAIIELIKGNENDLIKDIIALDSFTDIDLKEFLSLAVYSPNLEATKIFSTMVDVDHTHAILHASLGGNKDILDVLLSVSKSPLFLKTMDCIAIQGLTTETPERNAILKEYVNDEYGARLDYVYVDGDENKDKYKDFNINEELLSGTYSFECDGEIGCAIFFQYKDKKYEYYRRDGSMLLPNHSR